MTGDSLSDESDDTKDGGSDNDDDDDDDDVSVDSKDSLGQHVKSTDEAIPHDAFEILKFWMPWIWEYYKPHLLNDVVRVSYLLSPDPTIMAFASKPRTEILRTGWHVNS